MVAISAAYNNNTDSPGVDLSLSGLSGFNKVTVERVINGVVHGIVRGLDTVNASDTMFATDYEAPINRPLTYRIIGWDFDPEIEQLPSLGTASTGTTSCTPAFPSGLAATDTSLLWVVVKPYTATVATPAGWTLVEDHTNGTTASGVDTGSTHTYLFRREGAHSGSFTVTGSGSNVILADIRSYRKSVADAWTYAAVEGGDSSHGADFSATAGANLTPVTTDLILFGLGLNTDAGLGVYTDLTLALANSGLSSTVRSIDTSSSSGDDAGLLGGYAHVTYTDGAGAPSVTYTLAASSSGTAIFLKLSTTGSSSSEAVSNTVTLPFANFGDVWIKSVAIPALSRKVAVEKWEATTYPTAILGKHKVLGRKLPVIITDVYGHREVNIDILSDNDIFPGTWAEIYQLLTEGGTLLVQTADSDFTGELDMFCEVDSYNRIRLGKPHSNGKIVFRHEIKLVEVDRPDTSEESLGLRSYQDVLDENATYNSITIEYTDYLDLLVRSI